MLISRNLILQGFLKSGSKSCKPEVTFAIHPAFVQFSESVKELCVIDKNDAFYGAETIDSHKEMW